MTSAAAYPPMAGGRRMLRAPERFWRLLKVFRLARLNLYGDFPKIPLE